MVAPLLVKVAFASPLVRWRSTIGAACTRGPEVATITAVPAPDFCGVCEAGDWVGDCGCVTAREPAIPVES